MSDTSPTTQRPSRMNLALLAAAVAAALITTVVLVGCGSSSSKKSSSSAPSEIRIAYQLIPNGDLIVKDKGWLEKAFPNHIITVSLRAEMLVAKNEPDQAFELLKGFIDSSGAHPPEKNLRIRLVAEKLEQLAQRLTKPGQIIRAAWRRALACPREVPGACVS